MAPLTDVGMITIAFGSDRFFEQANTLARSLRRYMPNHKITLVTDRPDANPLFDYTIQMNPIGILGTFLKTDLYEYSPFAETFFINSDCVVLRNFSSELAEIRKFDFSPVVSRYLGRGDTDLWLRDVGEAIEVSAEHGSRNSMEGFISTAKANSPNKSSRAQSPSSTDLRSSGSSTSTDRSRIKQ